MTVPTVHETPEYVLHIEAQEREIEAKEEIIRLQADEITHLTRLNAAYAGTLRRLQPGVPLEGDFPE